MKMDIDIRSFVDEGLRRLRAMSREEALRLAVRAALPVITLSLLAGTYSAYSRTQRLATARKAEMERFAVLKADYTTEKARVERLSRKAAPAGVSAVSAVESLAASLNMRGKIASLKPLGESAVAGYVEREVELRMERVDLNELVNFLFQAENGARLLAIKEFSMKSRFEDPDLFDSTMRVSFIVKAPS